MNLQIGDLITAYHKGYHKITKIDPPRSDGIYIIYYEQILTSKFTKPRAKIEYRCGDGWCEHLNMESVRVMRKYWNDGFDKLEQVIKENSKN